MGSSGMKRKGRHHLRKLRGHSRRGGGVTHFDSTPWGPMNVMDGGRDAPGTPPTRRTRIIVWTLLAVLIVAAGFVIAISLSG